jgi:ribosomal-protein-alanine N-acetyltransferase
MGKTAPITIAPLLPEDLDEVLAIEKASFTMPWSRNLFLSEFRNRPVSLMLAAHRAGDRRELAGYIVCWVVADEVHILDLATRSDLRKRGIARNLVLAALRTAYARGALRAFLEVRESNRAALKLYEGLGFERTQVRVEYYDLPIEDAIVMLLGSEGLHELAAEAEP